MIWVFFTLPELKFGINLKLKYIIYIYKVKLATVVKGDNQGSLFNSYNIKV